MTFDAVDVPFVLRHLFPNCCCRHQSRRIVIKAGGLSVQSLKSENFSRYLVARKVVVAHLSFVSEDLQYISSDQSESKNTSILPFDDFLPSQTSTLSAYRAEKQDLSFPVVVDIPYNGSSVARNDGPHETLTDIRKEQPTHRASYLSIDILAHVSAAIMDEGTNDGGAFLEKLNGDTSSKGVQARVNERELLLSYKTHKNQAQTRHVVQHSYQDLSRETPPEICENSVLDCIPISTTSSVAFPMKLHEAFSQIQRDKNDHIFGWLSHGRLFKIHPQHDFAILTLPQYFAMDKKVVIFTTAELVWLPPYIGRVILSRTVSARNEISVSIDAKAEGER